MATLDPVENRFDGVVDLPTAARDIQRPDGIWPLVRRPVWSGVELLGTLSLRGIHQLEGQTLILSFKDVLDQRLDQDAGGDPALDGLATRVRAAGLPAVHGHVECQGVFPARRQREE